SLDAVYKLQEYAGKPRRKRSAAKATWPGRKQVYRRYGADGSMDGDVVAEAGETVQGEPLLVPVMRGGRRVGPPESLAAIRARAAADIARLPEALRRLETAAAYPVMISDGLRRLAAEADATRAD